MNIKILMITHASFILDKQMIVRIYVLTYSYMFWTIICEEKMNEIVNTE